MSKTIEEMNAKQIHELTDWKESASKVFKNLDLQAIGKTLGIGLGEDVSTNVLPKIKELQEQNAELVRLLEELSKTTSGSRFLKIKHEAKELLTKYQKP
ncbi:hypothetical protein [Sphingobacterium sp. 1.A.5]|uniref:hypothetical protein n=1 Tax=Sphingobacterium sp. 1.A.5 TaxID=2044604 RepID=UPI000C0C04EF|nr:hypothetical protein [Sphingobacterium sp. 1.A.5]